MRKKKATDTRGGPSEWRRSLRLCVRKAQKRAVAGPEVNNRAAPIVSAWTEGSSVPMFRVTLENLPNEVSPKNAPVSLAEVSAIRSAFVLSFL